jgi:hypothetical protein
VKPLGDTSLMTTSKPLKIQRGQPLHYLYVRGNLLNERKVLTGGCICSEEAGVLALTDARHVSTVSGNVLDRAAL